MLKQLEKVNPNTQDAKRFELPNLDTTTGYWIALTAAMIPNDSPKFTIVTQTPNKSTNYPIYP